MQRTQSLTRPTTYAAITTFSTSHNSISSQYSQPFTSLAAPKANLIFHAANKNLFTKTHFDSRHLITSSSSFYFLTTISEGPYKLSEETTQRKHIRYNLSSLTNKLSLATNKPTSPAKIILQKLRLKIECFFASYCFVKQNS